MRDFIDEDVVAINLAYQSGWFEKHLEIGREGETERQREILIITNLWVTERLN